MNIQKSNTSLLCERCGKVKSKYKRFCSHKCANIFSAPSRERKIILICKACGNKFKITKGSLKVRKVVNCCSRKCNGKYQSFIKRIVTKCDECGRSYQRLKSRKSKRKFCSLLCCKKYFITHPRRNIIGFWYEKGYKVLYNGGNHKKEHILIMESIIGRKLKKNEVVHHINRVRDDNRIENLKLMKRDEHTSWHRKESYSKRPTCKTTPI